jgi:hypothetical protein
MSTHGKEGMIRIEWKYAEDFKRVNVTSSFGIAGDYDYHLIFGTPRVEMQPDSSTLPKAQGEYKVELILPFRAVKELRNLLDEGIKNIEMRFGEIKLPKKPEDVFKQP